MTDYCPECGIPLADGARLCTNCGASALEQALVSRVRIESARTSLGEPDERPAGVGPAEPASFLLARENAASAVASSSQAAEEQLSSAQPVPAERVVEAGAGNERPELRIELESVRKPTLTDFFFSLRLILDRHRLMWQAGGNITAWVLFAVFSLLAYVTADQSQVLPLLLRVMGWGVLIVLLLVTAAAIAASVIAEISSDFQLERKASSAILSRLPAIVGPTVVFLGLSAIGVGLLAVLGAVARVEGSGEILWAALALPQFFIALATMVLLVMTCASFVYGPTLAVTDGASLSQTLFRFFLIFRRDFSGASGYFLLVATFSFLVGVVVWGVSALLLGSIDWIAAETSQGRTATIIAFGNDLARRLVPGGFLGLVSSGSDAFASFSQVESTVRLAGFLWSLSLVVISAMTATFPLLSLSVAGATATSILLTRLASERIAGEKIPE